jgi:hypothetical protein
MDYKILITNDIIYCPAFFILGSNAKGFYKKITSMEQES